MRLAIIVSHPIQYYSPWFRYLAANGLADLKVFFLWDGGVTEKLDRGFGVPVKWDIPLLEGFDYRFVPNRSPRPGTDSWRGLDNPELTKYLAAYKPDAILLFGYNHLTHYRLLFSRLGRNIPIIFRGDSHRLFPESGIRSMLRRWWIKAVFRRCKAFLYVGAANKAYFRLHSVPECRLFFAPHAVDNQWFFSQTVPAANEAKVWKASLGIAPSQRVVLFAGKFEPKKRPRDLLAAFLRANFDNTAFLLVGNGVEEEALRRDATGQRNVFFAPFQNQTHMPRTYAAADVFVLPSYGRGETWGLAINEALCLSRAVIVSDHVGCAQDLVQSKRNGLVFKAGSVEALTAALRDALSDPKRLVQWGTHGREIVKAYDYEHSTRGLLEALEFVKRGNQT